MCFSETSVTKYQPTPRNIREERRHQLYRNVSLQSCQKTTDLTFALFSIFEVLGFFNWWFILRCGGNNGTSALKLPPPSTWKTALFWVITQLTFVIFTDVSGQPIGPISKTLKVVSKRRQKITSVRYSGLLSSEVLNEISETHHQSLFLPKDGNPTISGRTKKILFDSRWCNWNFS